MRKMNTYRVNSPRVIYELFEDEVVVLNLEKGHYYSISNTGVEIWKGLTSARAGGEIINRLERRYPDAPLSVSDSVENFINRLLELEIIVENHADRQLSPEKFAPQNDPHGKEFLEPVLEVYTDMEELLLIDPVHEVDESGWPHPLPDHDPDSESR